MGKKKSKSGGKPKDHGEYRETNEFHDGLEMDGADAFEAMQDAKNNLKMGQIKSRHKIPDVSGGVEELYALSGDSDSDDENLPEGVEFDDDDEQTVIRYTGCPVNWYSLLISIPDFSDCLMKKI